MAEARKRRLVLRPRFSLWALLVLITVIAIPLSYVAQGRNWNLRRVRTIRELVGKKFEFGFTRPTYADLGIDNPAPSGDPFEPIRPASKGSLQYWWDEICQNGLTDNLVEAHSLPIMLKDGNQPRDLLSDDDLRRLLDFPELESIHFFHEKKITDAGLSAVTRLPKLTHLDLDNLPNCSGRFARQLSSNSVLQVLSLSRLDHLNCAELTIISRLKKLESVFLDDCAGLGDDALKEVDLPAQLKHLRIASDSVGDQTLSRWLASTRLEYLDIECFLTRAIGPQLAQQTNLISLHIRNAPFRDEDFAFLSKCKELQRLRLCEMPIKGEFLTAIPLPEQLEYLDLTATLVSDQQLASLRRFTKLKRLNLRWCPIQGEALAQNPDWPRIDEVSFSGAEFSENGKNALAVFSGPRAVRMPGNWTVADEARFRGDFAKYKRPIGEDASDFLEQPEYWPGGNLHLRMTSELPGPVRLTNAPKELMAPVLRLLELAKAKGTKE